MKEPKRKLSLELIEYIEPIKEDKRGIKTVLEVSYYENECLIDVKDEPFTYFVFIREFSITVSKKGVACIKQSREVKTIYGKTKKLALTALNKVTDNCDGQVNDGWEEDYKWVPDEVQQIYDSIKSGAVRV